MYTYLPWRDLISRPMAPQAETIPLDHAAKANLYFYFSSSGANSAFYNTAVVVRLASGLGYKLIRGCCSPFRGRCYDHNLPRILPIFCEKIGVFLKNQCYDPNFTQISRILNKNANFFAIFCKFFCKFFRKFCWRKYF
jgi:hypothetical protein